MVFRHILQFLQVAKPRQASGFSVYVKQHFARTKASLPAGTSTAEVMKELAAQYKTDKAAAQQAIQQADGNAADGTAHPMTSREVYEIDEVDDCGVEVVDADDVADDCGQDVWLEQVGQQVVDLTI